MKRRYAIKTNTDNANHSTKASIILINKERLSRFITSPAINNNTIKIITATKSGKILFIVFNLKG